MKLQRVFEPFRLGPLTARNRIFVPAHTTNFGADRLPTERHVAYHRARARGGAALLITAGLRPVLVGDCLAPRNALEAIFEGHRAARAF